MLTGPMGGENAPAGVVDSLGPSYSRPRLGECVGEGHESWRREGVTQLGWDRWSVSCNSLLQGRIWEGQESVSCLLRKRLSVPFSPDSPPPPTLTKNPEAEETVILI